ncbi:MAG: recombinase family protein [Planctomycetes bacterium]|nr:recombinase family protein [Planctomycetota bacterium]
MANESKRAAGYIRVSQERAARNGYGLGAQETDIQRFALFKQWDLVGIYREEGVSGYRKDRPALNRLLAEVNGLALGVVIFPSIDRAGRSVKDVIDIDRALRAAGVNTVFLRESIDTSTPTGQLFRNIMASLAQFEGRMICERLHKGLKRKAAEGKYRGGWIAYGYRVEKGRLLLVPEQAEVVRRIFAWVAEGRSQTWMLDRLNEGGAPTLTGSPWRFSTLQHILKNRFYTGRVAFEEQWIAGEHPPIVSKELFDACQPGRNGTGEA